MNTYKIVRWVILTIAKLDSLNCNLGLEGQDLEDATVYQARVLLKAYLELSQERKEDRPWTVFFGNDDEAEPWEGIFTPEAIDAVVEDMAVREWDMSLPPVFQKPIDPSPPEEEVDENDWEEEYSSRPLERVKPARTGQAFTVEELERDE